jgi:hypothetical protein
VSGDPPPLKIDHVGDYVLVANGTAGVGVLDVAYPAHPVLQTFVVDFQGGAGNCIAVKGFSRDGKNYFVTTDSSHPDGSGTLWIYEVSHQ